VDGDASVHECEHVANVGGGCGTYCDGVESQRSQRQAPTESGVAVAVAAVREAVVVVVDADDEHAHVSANESVNEAAGREEVD
jgi:hypothetical protein